MTSLKPASEFHNYGHLIIPQLSIDCVVFGFHENQIKVLLFKWKDVDYWALPGGFVFQTETVQEAANRILEEKTKLTNIYLDVFNIFGETNRKFGETHRLVMESQGYEYDENHWLCQRFVSIGHYALVDFTKITPQPDDFAEICDWFDINDLPKLSLDHPQILKEAFLHLRQNLDNKLIGFNLLPETFTMAELQNLYETFLGKPLSRTNFQRKMLGLGILERVEKKYSGGSHKAPYLYRFDKNKGQAFLEKENMLF